MRIKTNNQVKECDDVRLCDNSIICYLSNGITIAMWGNVEESTKVFNNGCESGLMNFCSAINVITEMYNI